MRICFLLTLTTFAATQSALAQTAADGPWSGQAQCAISTTAPNYREEQTHTWRLTGGAAAIVGSMRIWPASWSVRGSGTQAVPPQRWSIDVPEQSAPISTWDIPAQSRVHFASTHSQLKAAEALHVSGGRGETTTSSVWEWLFPIAEDAATSTTISGTRTRTIPVGPGWQRPDGALTTETCTWSFTRVVKANETIATTPLKGDLPLSRTALPHSRTITVNGFTGAGVFAAAVPRSVTVAGFTGVGTFASRAPATVTVTGWTGAGSATRP